MAVTGVHNIDLNNSIYGATGSSNVTTKNDDVSFDNLFNSAVNMYKETDALQNAAEESEMNFALGFYECARSGNCTTEGQYFIAIYSESDK